MPKVSDAYLAERRQEILNAAWACLARQGYHRTTMQDICEESGLSYGAIYRYFSSKEEVLHAIFEHTAKLGRSIVDEARAGADGPRGALDAIGRATFSLFDDPAFERVARTDVEIWPEMLRSDSLRDRFRENLRYWHGVVAGLVRAAQEDGEVRGDIDADVVAALDMCVVDGLRRYRLIDPDLFEPEGVRSLLNALAEGGR